jgi:predicted alpha/beta-hydrolase family hydrolase
LAGGHSYGGRQTSITAAENSKLIDALLLLSYPLHPPRRPNELRTAHFSTLRTPCLFVHGTRDPFGSPDEMRSALRLIPVATELCLIEGAGHDLMNPADISRRIVDQVVDFVAAL